MIPCMKYVNGREEDTHDVRQEIRELSGQGQVPTDLVLAVLRLSGGYQRIDGRLFVEVVTEGDRRMFAVYWISGQALGIVTCSTPLNPDTSSPSGGVGTSSVTARVVSLENLRSVEATEPVISAENFDPTQVEIAARWVLTFDGDVQIELPAATNSQREERLDMLVDEALAVLYGEPT